MTRLLLLSNSKDPAGRYLEHPRELIASFLGSEVSRVLFVPFAGVTVTPEEYTDRVGAALRPLGYQVQSIAGVDDPIEAVGSAEAIAVGGGNTFRLTERLHATGLMDAIGSRVRSGLPYMGWSAGSVVACPTIRTTNDMPVVQPLSFASFGFVPFQINPHYTEFHPAGFQGETREMRLAEFVELNRETTVVGLPEGTTLRVEGGAMSLHGGEPARVFRYGREKELRHPGDVLDDLLASGMS
jgi:dipeptidase E